MNLRNVILNQFEISSSTCSSVILKWIDIFYKKFSPLIKWPDRDVLLETIPMSFRKHFKKVVVVVDCFEVFCEKPKNHLAKGETSNYNSRNTVKFLIGITPQGVISFISKGRGGRASDEFITENCGILKKLEPGDVVMADQGFNVEEAVGSYGASVTILSFTRGLLQLSGREEKLTNNLSENSR